MKAKVVVTGVVALVLCAGPAVFTAVVSHGNGLAILLGLGMGALLSISLLMWVFDPPDPNSDFDF